MAVGVVVMGRKRRRRERRRERGRRREDFGIIGAPLKRRAGAVIMGVVAVAVEGVDIMEVIMDGVTATEDITDTVTKFTITEEVIMVDTTEAAVTDTTEDGAMAVVEGVEEDLAAEGVEEGVTAGDGRNPQLRSTSITTPPISHREERRT